MKQLLNLKRLSLSFTFCLLTVFVLALSGQSSDDSAPGIRAPEPSEEFRLLSALEVDAHQTELYREIKEKFNSSKLKETHQDLLAKALSKVVSSTITEETGADTEELAESFEVFDNGFIESENGESRFYFADMHTPFTIDGDIPFDDFGKGRVLKENKSELTVRFTKIVNCSDQESSVDFLKDFPFLKDIKWALELTVDKNDQTLKRFSSYLAKPIRVMFICSLKTLKATYDFEYFEDCDCGGVKERRVEVAGSLIFVGRLVHKSTETYSEIACEQPVRYLAPWVTSFDTFKVRF